ncbi:hypothetical protein JDV02_002206 [Purpureocillium takamizusanense]|uniref:Uncharacterized protein n=1 Tax=Purpureocillium takamizusanense TaxID=2060973 RepID=A0A9Q8V777_9HYPO|nr:uncharacterized protein JDV02_002206 [Purpureocillium takamizusanense]UNI15695.1 hypothetical protein JDV02_002206 [Purpureocillium takamizusanense]
MAARRGTFTRPSKEKELERQLGQERGAENAKTHTAAKGSARFLVTFNRGVMDDWLIIVSGVGHGELFHVFVENGILRVARRWCTICATDPTLAKPPIGDTAPGFRHLYTPSMHLPPGQLGPNDELTRGSTSP